MRQRMFMTASAAAYVFLGIIAHVYAEEQLLKFKEGVVVCNSVENAKMSIIRRITRPGEDGRQIARDMNADARARVCWAVPDDMLLIADRTTGEPFNFGGVVYSIDRLDVLSRGTELKNDPADLPEDLSGYAAFRPNGPVI